MRYVTKIKKKAVKLIGNRNQTEVKDGSGGDAETDPETGLTEGDTGSLEAASADGEFGDGDSHSSGQLSNANAETATEEAIPPNESEDQLLEEEDWMSVYSPNEEGEVEQDVELGDTWSEGVVDTLVAIVDDNGSDIENLYRKISQARIDDPPDYYIRNSIEKSLKIGVASLFAVLVLSPIYLYVQSAGELSISDGVTSIGAAAFAWFSVTALGLTYYFGRVLYKVYERERNINRLLPDAIAFLYTQSSGGLNELDMIRSLAEAEDTYGEVSREFQAIVRQSEYFGDDYKKAIAMQAKISPSDEMTRFLTDMLTVLRSGGDLTQFLKKESDTIHQHAKSDLERELNLIELLAQMYLVMSLLPLLTIVVLIIMSSMQPMGLLPIIIMIYVVVPSISIVFIILISGLKSDELGNGVLSDKNRHEVQITKFTKTHTEETKEGVNTQRTMSSAFGTDLRTDGAGEEEYTPRASLHPAGAALFDTSEIEPFDKGDKAFDKIRKNEIKYRIKSIVRSPIQFVIERPAATVPVTFTFVFTFLITGMFLGQIVPPTTENMIDNPVPTTFWWFQFPIIAILTPVAVFYQLRRRIAKNMFKSFPPTLRKIASANDTGMTLVDSIGEAVSDKDDKLEGDRLKNELNIVHKKSKFGVPLEQGLTEFNNSYKDPQVARIVRLVIEAQKTSENITGVLKTTVKSAEEKLLILADKNNKTQVQVLLIIVTSIIVLVIMTVLDRIFLPLITDGGLQAATNPEAFTEGGEDGPGQGGLEPEVGTVFLLHSILVHALFSGFLAGYIRSANLLAGVKYVVAMFVIISGAWMII